MNVLERATATRKATESSYLAALALYRATEATCRAASKSSKDSNKAYQIMNAAYYTKVAATEYERRMYKLYNINKTER